MKVPLQDIDFVETDPRPQRIRRNVPRFNRGDVMSRRANSKRRTQDLKRVRAERNTIED